MPDWRVLIADRLHESGKDFLRQFVIVGDHSGISPAELLEAISKYDGLIVRSRTKVTEPVLKAGSRLKVVGRAGVGVDNIDLQVAQALGVHVVNAPTATSIAVAEHTIALMLALARQIPRADAGMKTGQWIKNQLKGAELAGKTLGLVGIGRIGAAVAQRAAPFGMNVLGYDPLISSDLIQSRGAEPVGLKDIYQSSDYLSFHVPLTPETRNMVDTQVIASMKPGVRIISTARGGVIDEKALLAALETGQVAGAALDVFKVEPPGQSQLVEHPMVIATPHIAGQTAESQSRVSEHIASEVLAALRGETLRWKVA